MSGTRVAKTDAESLLREVGQGPDSGFDLAEAALALASLDRPRVGLDHNRHHLQDLARDVADRASGDDLDHCIGALNEIILERHGYEGDQLTYEDLQNANLMRVIDRRCGLPVALGIVYLQTALSQGWDRSVLPSDVADLLRKR